MTDEPMLDGPNWMTATDAAALARIDVDTLRVHRQHGGIIGYNGMTGDPFGVGSVLGGYLLRFKHSDVVALFNRLHPWLGDPLPTGWRHKARCRGLAPEDADRIFFPEVGHSYSEALSYCRACPVRRECLTWATMVGVEDGMFGGAPGSDIITYNLHWRRTGALPKVCEMCGKTYSNATQYCSLDCADADGIV